MFYPLRLTPFTSSLSRSYILPALLLNPILFLHSLNSLLAHILPPVIVPNAAEQPPPYYSKGPSAQNPHLDIHASDGLCWSYTAVLVGVQLVAFGRIQMRRGEQKERVRRKKEGNNPRGPQKIGFGMNETSEGRCIKMNGAAMQSNGKVSENGSSHPMNGHSKPTSGGEMGTVRSFDDLSDDEGSSQETTDSEIIL